MPSNRAGVTAVVRLAGDGNRPDRVAGRVNTPLPQADQPGGRRPAPGDLALVQAFVNTTNDIEGGEEQLRDAGAFSGWLIRAGLCPSGTRASEEDLALAISLREGLRALACANNHEPADHRTVRRLNAAARRVGLTATFDVGGGWHLSPSHRGVEGALGKIVGTVAEAMAEGTWRRMKACKRDRCRWLFYDHSKNRSGVWCTMQICGNKEKAAAYRRRGRPARYER